MNGDSLSTAPISVTEVADLLGVSVSHVRQLADRDVLPSTRTKGGHRRFDPIAVLEAWNRYLPARHKPPRVTIREQHPLAGTDEDALWSALAPQLALPARAEAVAQYITTEMVNNAIDHSQGTTVTVTAVREHGLWTIEVVDDGDGIFEHLATGLDLDSRLESLAELTKGKRTTDPTRHTGEGIFFSSKAAEVFTIEANGWRLTFDNEREDFAYGVSPINKGTVVRYTMDPKTERTIQRLFEQYTDDEFRFSRTVPRIKLYEIGTRFVSRSEAKRLGIGLEQFSEVELDFAGVTDVGQGFADELFRVWAGAHPDTSLLPIKMNEAVTFMVHRTRSN